MDGVSEDTNAPLVVTIQGLDASTHRFIFAFPGNTGEQVSVRHLKRLYAERTGHTGVQLFAETSDKPLRNAAWLDDATTELVAMVSPLIPDRATLDRLVEQCCSEDGLADSDQETYGDIGEWDITLVTNLGWLFKDQHDFNRPIGEWDTSRVTTMSAMFWNAASYNQPLGEWDTSSVTSMYNICSLPQRRSTSHLESGIPTT